MKAIFYGIRRHDLLIQKKLIRLINRRLFDSYLNDPSALL